MYCGSCGDKIKDGAKFCSKCGAKTDGNQVSRGDDITVTKSKNVNFGLQKNSNNKTYKIQIGSIIIIGFLAITSYFFLDLGSGGSGGISNGTYVLEDGLGIGYNELVFKGDEVTVNPFASTGLDLGMLMTFKYKTSGGTLTLSETKDGAGITYTYEKNGNSIILNGSIYIKK